MNALEVVINDLKNKQKLFDPSFKDSAASMFVSKAGQSKEEKRQRGEHEQDKESKSINLADLEVAMGEQILMFEDAAVKATKSTVAKMGEGAKNKMAKVAMQVARTPTYVAPTAMHLLHKARSPMAKGVNKALNHNLSEEDQIIRSIVRSLCWSLIQPAFRMQYDYSPLLGAAQSLAKSKHGAADSADVLETVTEGSAATSGINKAASAQSEQGSGEAEKSRQEVLEPSLKKAQQASESLLAQVSLGGNGALRDVLKHYQLSDLTQLSEQLQSLSLSEETPDTKIRPPLGKDVQTLKNLLAQEPSNRGAELNQISASERERLVNILATIKDMGLSEQRFNKTVDYFLGVGQEVLSEQGQESLGKAVVEIEDALRKGEAYKKVRAMALRLRARATKASDYSDSSLDSIIHKARFAGLAAQDAYDELDSLALKHTGQPLGPFSRRSRVAKDLGMCANEVQREAGHTDAALIPDTEVIRHALTERDMLTGLVSDKDPLGIFFSTRIAGEWRYAYRDQTIKPMSPAEYAAQEKTLAEFIVSWSQKRLARGVVVSFIEGGMDVVGGLTVTPIKIGIRAGIKVPISLIRIGYDVHKIKQGVMPGEDKPYKVIKARITHRLEQLGFKMVMIPVGNTVKTVFAAGVSAAAHAHNAMVEKEEDKVKISSWAKVLGTEALLTGGSVPVTLGAKTAANLVIDPSPSLTTDEQQVVEQIKQALAGESEPQEMDAVDESSPISNAYPGVDRGKGEYKDSVDASLAKIASTPFGRDLIESMDQQGIRITMPSDSAHTLEGEHNHEPSSGNYANPDKNTVFFDPSYKVSAEDVKSRPWLDCDPSIVLFHEMLHLHYSENPIQFEVSGQTYQVGGLGDPISEHMVAGADYVNDKGVEFRFSDPEWVKQHLQAGQYVNENDLRRVLNQPIREDYYFDARNTGANQARFYNENGEDDSFGRMLYVAMNALRSDTGFRLPKMGDSSNKEREVWDKLADDLPIKASSQVGFSLSESRFIRDHSHIYSVEKLAHTIEYYHRNGLTPWYDNSAHLDRDFYFRLSDITLDNGHIIKSEDIQLYLELYGGPEKFVEDNVDSGKGEKEARVVGMVAQRIDDIRTGQNSIASVNEDFFYRSFITDYFMKRNITASTPVVGYHSEGKFREGNFHPHGQLTTGPNWQSGIQAFTVALESAGYTGPFKEVDFDETFYWYEGQHLRTYYDVYDLVRNDHRHCIQRADRVYVYRGEEDKDLIYVSGQIVEVPRDNGQQNTEIDIPQEVCDTLSGPVLMMGEDIKLILPRKKMETLMTVATRRDTASYTYQISNADYHTVQNSDVQTEFTEKLDSRFEGNNRRQIEEDIEYQLKYTPLMRINCESNSDKEDIRQWLNEFSSGTRKGVFASHECKISDINSIQNPDVFYIPLSQGDSTKYDGLMINWARGEVIPIPRDLKQRLTLFKTPQFRSSFTESLSQSNIDRLSLKTGQYSTWSKMDNISGYLNELRSASPLDMDEKIEILNMCLDYVAMVAVGQKSPDDDEIQALLDLFAYVRPDWGGKVINGLSRSEEADILYSSRMNNFVATMHLQTSYHSVEGREYSVDQFPNKLTDFLVDKLAKDFDYHVTSASEEKTQRIIESLRDPLRWSSYVLAVGLGVAFPGFAAGVIGGMVTTFLTDTVLDIAQLETEDNLEKRQQLLEGIIAKCYISLGAELGGAVFGPAAGKLVKWMTKTVTKKILRESTEEVMQMIDNIDLRTIQEKIDIERGVSSQNVIETRWGRIRSRVKAENSTVRARKSPITRELTEEQRNELLENQMSDTLRKYSTFESIVDNNVKIRDVLKAAAILGVINELMVEVDKALDPNISGNAFYQIAKMWFVYSLAGASGEVLNIKTADDLLEEAMTKLDVPPQKRIEFLQKVRDERISKQRLLDDPQVRDAMAAMDSTDPVVSSTRELIVPDGRSSQEMDFYPEDNWSDEANRIMRLLDDRDVANRARDDLTPQETGAMRDGHQMQVQAEVHQLAPPPPPPPPQQVSQAAPPPPLVSQGQQSVRPVVQVRPRPRVSDVGEDRKAELRSMVSSAKVKTLADYNESMEELRRNLKIREEQDLAIELLNTKMKNELI
ncbi:M91 family zinc metallopeptidase [Vibrio pectenicida]|uniref:M91 family zinc metallopeptidase n=1 Tax=Vibrio pectenicida TaxID=62763 RepID=UPI003B9C6382